MIRLLFKSIHPVKCCAILNLFSFLLDDASNGFVEIMCSSYIACGSLVSFVMMLRSLKAFALELVLCGKNFRNRETLILNLLREHLEINSRFLITKY